MGDESARGGAGGGQIEVTPLGNGRFRIFDGRRYRIAFAAGPADARWVFLEGRVYLVTAAGPQQGRRAGTRSDDMALSAPMPATVTSLSVAPGQQVAQGDVLIVLEAMKMELAVKAPRDGRVKALACQPGELVQAGVPLVELE